MMRWSFQVAIWAASCSFLGTDPFQERLHASGVAPWSELGSAEFCRGSERIIPSSRESLGVCAPGDAPPPHACSGSESCASRERCVCGSCTALACEEDRDCGSQFACDLNEQQPRCAKPCELDQNCAEGEDCQLGVCRQSCASETDCQYGEVCSPTLGRCITAHCQVRADCLGTESCIAQHFPAALTSPAVISTEHGLVMYFDSEGMIFRATSIDGVAFEVDPVDPLFEGQQPAPLVTKSGTTLFSVRSGEIFRAESADGMHFGPAVWVLPGESPSAVEQNGTVSLFFVREGSIWRADEKEGASFLVAAHAAFAPEDAQDPLLWRSVETLDDPAAVVVEEERGSILRLYFTARGIESSSALRLGEPVPATSNYSIGYAAAEGADLARYPFNPIFDRTRTYLLHLEETGPSVVAHDGRYYLYYEAGPVGSPRADNIAVAVNPPTF